MGGRRGPESLEVAGGEACSRPLGAPPWAWSVEKPGSLTKQPWGLGQSPASLPRPWGDLPSAASHPVLSALASPLFLCHLMFPSLRKLFSGAASSTHLSTHSQLKDLPKCSTQFLGFVLKL